MRIREKYMSKEARDARFRQLKAAGHNVRRSTLRHVALHPDYVVDAVNHPGRGTGSTINGWYDTSWDTLYAIEETY
jgi:hypothetical protein